MTQSADLLGEIDQCNCGGDTIDLDTEVTDLPVSPGLPMLAGLIRDENGLPIEGATVQLQQEGEEAPSVTTDKFGTWIFNQGPYQPTALVVSADDRETLTIIGLPSSGRISLTLLAGTDERAITLPAPPSLSADRDGSRVDLSWSLDDPPAGFAAWSLVRASSSQVGLLDAQIARFEDLETTSVSDPNVTTGAYYYRLYLAADIDGIRVWIGSDAAGITVPPDDAFPDRMAFVMVKTAWLKEAGVIGNSANLVLAPTDTAQDIGAGKTVQMDGPLLEGTQNAMYIGKQFTKYKKNEQYFYGCPALYVGETRRLDEWDTKYAVHKEAFSSDAVIGKHEISLEGGTAAFDAAEALPDNRIEEIRLERNDGRLEVRWDMIEDGQPLAGGPGAYGWNYLVKIFYPGAYASGDHPDYEQEIAWTNFSIFDREKNIGFTRVCELARNHTQVEDVIPVPDGVFQPGQKVIILLYAISTDKSYVFPTSGIQDTGKAWLYWVFNFKASVTVP